MDNSIEKLKIKRLLKKINSYKGNGTSMITLIIPPKSQINIYKDMLTTEYGTASNIKSRVNRLSVLSAITSTQYILKMYKQVPFHGLVIFSGTVSLDDGKEKKINIHFEPFKPINAKKYVCDNKFHTEDLTELFTDDKSFAFIIIDGNGCLYSTVSGNNKNNLYKFSVQLTSKTRRGGQSALRFSRLRDEQRHEYIKKVAELSNKFFIENNKPNVDGIIIAGSANFKNVLYENSLFDDRLKKIVISIIDVSYGMENGLNQAINSSQTILSNLKLMNEKKILEEYNNNIIKDNGKYCFSIDLTIKALEMGAVEKLIIWENLEIDRFELQYIDDSNEIKTDVIYLDKNKQKKEKYFFKNDIPCDIISKESFIDWIIENYKCYGTNIFFVSDNTELGKQFTSGFGGIGGILRWSVDLNEYEHVDNIDSDNSDLNYSDLDSLDGFL